MRRFHREQLGPRLRSGNCCLRAKHAGSSCDDGGADGVFVQRSVAWRCRASTPRVASAALHQDCRSWRPTSCEYVAVDEKVRARGSREEAHVSGYAGVFGHDLADGMADVGRCGGGAPMGVSSAAAGRGAGGVELWISLGSCWLWM